MARHCAILHKTDLEAAGRVNKQLVKNWGSRRTLPLTLAPKSAFQETPLEGCEIRMHAFEARARNSARVQGVVEDSTNSPEIAAYGAYRLCWLCLGVMCILQASLNIGLRLFWESEPSARGAKADANATRLSCVTTEKEQLEARYEQLHEELRRCSESLAALEAQKSCPAGWSRSGPSMYYIGKGLKDWEQSREDCRERGSDLVIINSREEQKFIQELNLSVWIGLNETNSIWTWVDGSVLSSGYWRSGEPNEYRSGEDCVESKPDYESLNTWNDEHCTTQRTWVCERVAC